MESLKVLHEQNIVGTQQEISALTTMKDLEISLLIAENESQRHQLGVQISVLNEAKEEARLANKAKSSAEKQYKTNTAELNTSIMDRDEIIAERDRSVVEATERAKMAEKAKKTLEDKIRSNHSDHDSALRKKQNTVADLKRACEQATEDGNTAHREPQDARSQASKDKKKVTELKTRVAGLTKRTDEPEAQVKEKTCPSVKDGSMTNMREEKQRLVNDVKTMTAERDRASKDKSDIKAKDEQLIGELKSHVTKANNLREVAEAKASE